MKDDYSKSVTLNCPFCGCRSFVSNNGVDTCQNCKKSFTRQQLQNANKNRINATLEQLKKEAVSDVKKDIKKMFEKSFGKNLKVK